MGSSVSSSMQIRNISAAKVERRKAEETLKSMFGSAKSAFLRGLETEQVHQDILADPWIAIMCNFDTRVADMLNIV